MKMLFCGDPSTGLYVIFLLESTFLGATLTGTVISARLMTSNVEDLTKIGLSMSRQWFLAMFFSLLPISIIQIAMLLTLLRASQLQRSAWLLPYIIWRMLLSLLLVISMILIGIKTWPTPGDREFITWIFGPMVVSIALGIWTLTTVLQIRASWLAKTEDSGYGQAAAANIAYHQLGHHNGTTRSTATTATKVSDGVLPDSMPYQQQYNYGSWYNWPYYFWYY